jgi:hypothetical protein
MVTSPFTDITGVHLTGGGLIIEIDDGYLVDAIGFGQADLDIFVAGAGDVLADVIGADGHLAMPAIDEDSQLYGAGSAEVDEGVHGGADTAAGIENVINKHDRLIVDISRDIRTLDSVVAPVCIGVIPVVAEVQGPDGEFGFLVSFYVFCQALG